MGPIAVGARARALRANTDRRQLLHHSIRNLLFDEELHTGSNLLRFDFDLDLHDGRLHAYFRHQDRHDVRAFLADSRRLQLQLCYAARALLFGIAV